MRGAGSRLPHHELWGRVLPIASGGVRFRTDLGKLWKIYVSPRAYNLEVFEGRNNIRDAIHPFLDVIEAPMFT